MTTSIREALEAVYEEAENQGQTEGRGSESKDSSESVRATPTPGEILDDKTPAPEIEAKEGADEKTAEPEAKVDETASKEGSVEKTEEKAPALRAPAGWSAQAREAFGSLPRVVQEDVLRRERDFAVGIQKNAEAGKFGNRVKEVLQPFQAIMQMEGADEIQAIHGLATTAASLRLGTPVEKAKTISNLIRAYGVDIQVLDDVLSGSQVNDEDFKIKKLLDEQMAPFKQMMTTINSKRLEQGQQVMQTVDAEIAELERTAEFLNDVRDDVADILELYANRGRTITMKEAYDRAVAMNPELQKIIKSREDAEKIKANAVRIDEKRRAAASVHGSGAGMAKVPAGSSIRESLEAAWDAHTG